MWCTAQRASVLMCLSECNKAMLVWEQNILRYDSIQWIHDSIQWIHISNASKLADKIYKHIARIEWVIEKKLSH